MPTGPTAPVELARKELPFPSYVDNLVLAGAAKTLTKPAGHSWLWIANSDLVYYRTGGTAIVPAADTGSGGGAPEAGEGSMPLPASPGIFLNVRSVATISFIGTAVCGYAWMRDASDL